MTTVNLDHGDEGLEWVEGVGFRPVDGLDLYLGGLKGMVSVNDCPVISVKDLSIDGVERVPTCEPDLPVFMYPPLFKTTTPDGVIYTRLPMDSVPEVPEIVPLAEPWAFLICALLLLYEMKRKLQ